MQSLAEALLAIARGQVPNITVGTTPVDVGGLIDELAAEMQPLMDDKRLTFHRKTKPIFAEVDANGIRRALAILLDNAMK